MVSPEDNRAVIAHVRQMHGVSERRACGLGDQPRSTQRYRAKTKADDGVRRRIADLSDVSTAVENSSFCRLKIPQPW